MQLDKEDLLDLEEEIIRTLDFSLRYVSPIHFLERYLRLFGIEKGEKNALGDQLSSMSHQYCRFMLREAKFLKYNPSAIAAASLLCSINLSQSRIAESILKIIPISKEQINSLFQESLNLHGDLSPTN